jgi:hypothetical protein
VRKIEGGGGALGLRGGDAVLLRIGANPREEQRRRLNRPRARVSRRAGPRPGRGCGAVARPARSVPDQACGATRWKG